jgi:hypothetical protein
MLGVLDMTPALQSTVALPAWVAASIPWLLAALLIAAIFAAVGVWTLVARWKELAALAQRFDVLESVDTQLKRIVADRGDLDLRRIEHVLLELRDPSRRLEDTLLRATQAARPGASSNPALPDIATLSDRVINRLLAHGYEQVQLVTRLDELGAIFEAEGGVGEALVEARRNGVLCKGRVLVRNGVVTDVEMQPAYSVFP